MTEDSIEQDDHSQEHGVLLSDEIEYYVYQCNLIRPYKPKNLRAASYDFTIGTEYFRGSTRYALDEQNPTLEIKPHESVVVYTLESLHMPRFLVGRWNPKVGKLFEGLVWVGGVHVDPGWNGRLRCPVYNLSRNPIILKLGDTFASIDFEKTTTYHKCKSKDYENKDRLLTHPGSGLEAVRDSVDGFTVKMDKLDKDLSTKMERYQSVSFGILTIIVAALAVIAVIPRGTMPEMQHSSLSIALSVGALFLSLVTLVDHIRSHKK